MQWYGFLCGGQIGGENFPPNLSLELHRLILTVGMLKKGKGKECFSTKSDYKKLKWTEQNRRVGLPVLNGTERSTSLYVLQIFDKICLVLFSIFFYCSIFLSFGPILFSIFICLFFIQTAFSTKHFAFLLLFYQLPGTKKPSVAPSFSLFILKIRSFRTDYLPVQ